MAVLVYPRFAETTSRNNRVLNSSQQDLARGAIFVHNYFPLSVVKARSDSDLFISVSHSERMGRIATTISLSFAALGRLSIGKICNPLTKWKTQGFFGNDIG